MDNYVYGVNEFMANILPRTAEIIVTYPSVSIIENR